jgi:hypothetical protein
LVPDTWPLFFHRNVLQQRPADGAERSLETAVGDVLLVEGHNRFSTTIKCNPPGHTLPLYVRPGLEGQSKCARAFVEAEFPDGIRSVPAALFGAITASARPSG